MFEQILRQQLSLKIAIDKWEVEYWKIEVIMFIVECSLGSKKCTIGQFFPR